MTESTRLARLRLFLRIYGVLMFVIFVPLSIGFVLQLPAMNPGGALHWLIWDDISGHVGPMLFVIYLVWGVFLLMAANDPLRYQPFLEFTMWANLAHGLLMVPMALEGSHIYHSKLLTDIPFLLGLSAGIFWLRPRREQQSVQTQRSGG